MAYIDVTYVKDRVREQLLKELTDDSENPTGAIVDAKITKAIIDIEARLNNVLRKIYTVPITSTNAVSYADSLAILKQLVLKCVIFQLYVQANIDAENIPGEYIDASTDLNEIESSKQTLSLYGLGLKTTNLTNIFVSNKTADDIVFDSDLWETY